MNKNTKNNLLILLIVSLASVVYAILFREWRSASSALVYVGVPALIAYSVIVFPFEEKTLLKTTFKVITVLTAVVAILFKEGFVCIFFAFPIVLIVSVLIIKVYEFIKKYLNKKLFSIAFFTLLIPASMEGVITKQELRNIEYEQVINLDIEKSLENFKEGNSIKSSPIELFIFPKPKAIEGKGLDLGDTRKIHFDYYKWFWVNKHSGDLVMQVIERDRLNKIVFKPTQDTSYISHYIAWQKAEFLFEDLNDNQTQIKVKLSYQPLLSPAWYFHPLMDTAVKSAA